MIRLEVTHAWHQMGNPDKVGLEFTLHHDGMGTPSWEQSCAFLSEIQENRDISEWWYVPGFAERKKDTYTFSGTCRTVREGEEMLMKLSKVIRQILVKVTRNVQRSNLLIVCQQIVDGAE